MPEIARFAGSDFDAGDVKALKPLAWTVTEYVPAKIFAMRKRPELSVVAVLRAAVPWLLRRTSALETTPPAGSTTVPSIELVTV